MAVTSVFLSREQLRRVGHEIRWACLALGVSAIGAVGLAFVGTSPLFPFVTALGVLVLTTVGCVVWNLRRFGDSLSLLSVAAVYYLLAFGAGAVYMWTPHIGANGLGNVYLHPRFAHADLTRAVVIATLGWLLLMFGYLANPLGGIRAAFATFHWKGTPERIRWLVLPLFILGWAARAEVVASGKYFHTPSSGTITSTGSSWIVWASSILPTLAVALIGAVATRNGKVIGRLRRKLFWLLLMIEFAWYLPTGERGSIVGLALMVAVVLYYGNDRHLRWKLVVPIVVFLVFVVFPFGLYYRGNNTQYQQAPKASLGAAFNELIGSSPRQALSAGAEATFSRFSDVAGLATVIHEGRTRMGIPPGQTFLWIPEVFIPRAVFHEKSDPGLFGNEFGRAYGIVAPSDRITSIAIGQVTDFYLNFAMVGVVIGMPLLGGLYRLINDIFSGRKTNPVTVAIYAVCLWPLISGMEIIVVTGVFGVLKTALFLFCCVAASKWLAASNEGLRVIPAQRSPLQKVPRGPIG